MKRRHLDGQKTKEEYEDEMYHDDGEHMVAFSRATPGAMAHRRIVSANRPSRKQEFLRHISALNTSFHQWFKKEIDEDSTASLIDGVQDYIDHACQLKDRYLRSHGEVLTFGNGECGQLAHGVENEEDTTVKYPRIVYSLRNKKVVGIACGGIHNAVFTETGQVYTWGCNDDGSLGRETGETMVQKSDDMYSGDENMPGLVEAIKDEVVIGVACGDGQTFAITVDGRVWGWGCYKDKEGGKWFHPSPGEAPSSVKRPRDDVARFYPPVQIHFESQIVELVCGKAYNMARGGDGSLYSFGLDNAGGELGRRVPELTKSSPAEQIYNTHIKPGYMCMDKPVKVVGDVVQVRFAGKDTWCPGKITATHGDGSMDVVYDDGRSEAGVSPGLVRCEGEPVRDCKAIGCGSNHSLVSMPGGVVLACGLNNYHQLGLETTANEPFLVPVPELQNMGITMLTGGNHHSLFLTSSGQMLALGRADYGQLGTDSFANTDAGESSFKAISPTMPPNTRVTLIACGGNHNLALTDKNAIYTWGFGESGALGHNSFKDMAAPKLVNLSTIKDASRITVTQVAGGGQHSAIIGQVDGLA